MYSTKKIIFAEFIHIYSDLPEVHKYYLLLGGSSKRNSRPQILLFGNPMSATVQRLPHAAAPQSEFPDALVSCSLVA